MSIIRRELPEPVPVFFSACDEGCTDPCPHYNVVPEDIAAALKDLGRVLIRRPDWDRGTDHAFQCVPIQEKA